jgi:hypothetical protein
MLQRGRKGGRRKAIDRGQVDRIVSERPSTHGDFEQNTVFMQRVKELTRLQPNWHKMEPYQREALEMIVHKMGRILHGDHEHLDHWEDIGGYAACVTRVLRRRIYKG